MNYDTVVDLATRKLREFKTEYDKALGNDLIDETLGAHSIFSLVFVPILCDAIKNNSELAYRMFDLIEEMESCGNTEVAEVVEFTILEEICDEFTDFEVVDYMGEETSYAFNCIRRYVPEAV